MSNASTTAGVRNTGLVFGGGVAVIAATASYSHMRELAYEHAAHDARWLSWLVPFSVDALMVVASIVAVLARRRGEKIPKLALVALVATLAISLMANFAAPAADMIGQLINIWPAAAFAFAYELVLELFQLEVKPRAKRARKTAPAGAVPSPVPAGATSEVPNPRAAEVDATASTSDAVDAAAAPVVGASLHIVEEAAPEWLTAELRTQPKAAMLRYLDENGDTPGAVLDRFGAKFLGTKPTLGRKVRREWLDAQQQKASGE